MNVIKYIDKSQDYHYYYYVFFVVYRLSKR